jgi:cell pole-organizing protein PopZ
MEDILTSIRRILSEEGNGADDSEKGPEGEEIMEREETPDDRSDISADESGDEFDREPRDEAPADPEPPAAARNTGDEEDGILLLTPEMRAPAAGPVMSKATAEASADALSQLARAILDHRDINIGSRDVTLEAMVRQMLRPLLKEWLDRNLPYLIERLVKKEIDLMINRAERL